LLLAFAVIPGPVWCAGAGLIPASLTLPQRGEHKGVSIPPAPLLSLYPKKCTGYGPEPFSSCSLVMEGVKNPIQ